MYKNRRIPCYPDGTLGEAMMQLQKVELLATLNLQPSWVWFTISRYGVGHRFYDPELTRGRLGLCEAVNVPVGYRAKLERLGKPIRTPRGHSGGWMWRGLDEVWAWENLLRHKHLVTDDFRQAMFDYEVADHSLVMDSPALMEVRSYLEREAIRKEAVESGAASSLMDGIL
jgi:hypothetical protein